MSTTDFQNTASGASPSWTPSRSPLSVSLTVLTLLPWAWLGFFAIFVVAVSLQHGHLPAYGTPDPKEAGLEPLYYFCITTIPLVFFTPLIWFGLLLAGHWRGWVRQSPLRRTALYAAGMALFFLVVVGDLWGLVNWLVD